MEIVQRAEQTDWFKWVFEFCALGLLEFSNESLIEKSGETTN